MLEQDVYLSESKNIVFESLQIFLPRHYLVSAFLSEWNCDLCYMRRAFGYNQLLVLCKLMFHRLFCSITFISQLYKLLFCKIELFIFGICLMRHVKESTVRTTLIIHPLSRVKDLRQKSVPWT